MKRPTKKDIKVDEQKPEICHAVNFEEVKEQIRKTIQEEFAKIVEKLTPTKEEIEEPSIEIEAGK